MVRAKLKSPPLRHMAGIIQLALIALTTYLLVRASIIFITPQSVWKAPQSSTTPISSASGGTVNYAFNFDPFHRDTQTIVVETEGRDAPETSLNLKMVGRRAGEGGSAIILTPDNKQEVYRVGDEIISGVILKNVTPEYIVLSQNGQLERLTFERAESALTQIGRADVNTVISQPSSPAGSLPNLMTAINLERVMEGNRVKGFKISPRGNEVNLSAFGFQSGDIITRIENHDLTAARPNLSKLFAELSQRSSANVTLLRGGQTLTVKVGQ